MYVPYISTMFHSDYSLAHVTGAPDVSQESDVPQDVKTAWWVARTNRRHDDENDDLTKANGNWKIRKVDLTNENLDLTII